MKKKTKVNKKKLDSLLLVLLLTAVLLIMSTYAWFTANRTVSIGNLDVRVETKSGLQISADAEDWKTVLELEDLQRAARYEQILNQLPSTMEPVSTALHKNGSGLKMFFGETEQENEASSKFVLTSKLLDETANEYQSSLTTQPGRYIAFDIYLKSGNAEENLYMSGNVVELELNNPDKIIEDPTQEKGITNASRIAIIPGNNDKDHITESETNAAWLRANLNTESGTPLMWEPNNDYHTEKAIAYDEETVEWNHGLAKGSGNAEIAYDGISDVINEGILLKECTSTLHNDKFAPVKKTWSTTKANTPISDLVMPKYAGATTQQGNPAALPAGVTKYRIYMWIEGQDIDCETYASGSRARFTLNFSLDSAGTPVNPK